MLREPPQHLPALRNRAAIPSLQTWLAFCLLASVRAPLCLADPAPSSPAAQWTTTPIPLCPQKDSNNKLYVIYYKSYEYDWALSEKLSKLITAHCQPIADVSPIETVEQTGAYTVEIRRRLVELQECLGRDRCSCYGKYLASAGSRWWGVLTVAENSGAASWVIDWIASDGVCIASTSTDKPKPSINYSGFKTLNELSESISGQLSVLVNPGIELQPLLKREQGYRIGLDRLLVFSGVAAGFTITAATLFGFSSLAAQKIDCSLNINSSLQQNGCLDTQSGATSIRIKQPTIGNEGQSGLLISASLSAAAGIGFGVGSVIYYRHQSKIPKSVSR